METRESYLTDSFATRRIDTRKLKAYSKMVQCAAGLLSALYELITDEEAPKMIDVLRRNTKNLYWRNIKPVVNYYSIK